MKEKKRRFGIRPKIMSGYIVMILCLIIAFVILHVQITSLQSERNHIISHEMEVYDLANQLEGYIIDMEKGQRGYLTTGKDSYLTPYHEGVMKWEDSYDELEKTLKGRKDQLNRLHDIKTTVEDWLNVAGKPAIEMRETNDVKGMQRLLRDDTGKSDMDQRRRQFNALRKNEQEDTKVRVAELDKRNSNLTVELFGILIGIALAGIGIAYITSRSILSTVQNVTGTIRALGNPKEHLKKRIHVRSRDEFNDLGDATNDLLDLMENRNWLQVNTADLLKETQGIASIQNLGARFLENVSSMVDASVGAFYIREEQDAEIYYKKIASVADEHDMAGRDRFMLGEGLVGQCATEKRIRVIENVPEDFRLIGSALGTLKPKQIVMVPILFENEAIAVVELAGIVPFTVQHKRLLQEAMGTFGITIHSVMTRMEVVRLLKESQTMTEELQAQHEELQTQSEELRMQSEELRTTNEQLEDRTSEAETKANELQGAKKELEQINTELKRSSNYKSEFLANMSHELRTPLNSILILSEMLSEQGTPESESTEYAKIIQSSGKDLLDLINDILDLSKVEAGKLEVVIDEMNLREFAELTELKFSHVAVEKGLELKVEKAANIPDIFYTDANRFQQIVKNLLSNAIKFTEKGTVTMKLQALQSAQLTTAMQQRSQQWLALSVIDTGIGIPKEKHQLIFEAFQQADGATSRKYGGTGLGLSICSEFVKLLGGSIMLDSKEGAGSKFTVILPSLPNGIDESMNGQLDVSEWFYPSDEAASELETENEHIHVDSASPRCEDVFKGKHALIVDDDQRNIFALRKVLEKQGMVVLEARDGLECMEMMEDRQDIDIVLMDIMMPRMDGYEAMQKIRVDLGLNDLPIIALTAKAMKQDREKCLEAGASDYISKPIVMEQLLSAMRVWLTPMTEES